MHAGDGHEVHVWRVGRAVVVAVDADPVEPAAEGDFLAADDGDVVFGLAGGDAGVAADAGVEVDDHAPGAAVIGLLRVEAGLGGGSAVADRGCAHVLDADEVVAFEGAVFLGGGEVGMAAGLGEGDAGG